LFLGTTAATYAVGLAADQPRLKRIGQELIVAFAVAAAGTQLVKHAMGRARPDQGDGPGHFVGPTLDDQFHSLWSGDVTKAFTLASVLSEEIGHPAVTITLYSLATATAFQRIHTNRHWFSDVVSAAVWSTAVGIGTVRINKFEIRNSKLESEGLKLHVIPTGLLVSW
jgi:membrane-associated phospholipid phosphatase